MVTQAVAAGGEVAPPGSCFEEGRMLEQHLEEPSNAERAAGVGLALPCTPELVR